ncbi:hypothetical protein Syun_022522 [Stephania yunnanensis]|uniref:Uncharacterized protein n=1 Tax=Stephania yunnanensis TaxID=152371 RepID=A0AAP0F842_9MAGN
MEATSLFQSSSLLFNRCFNRTKSVSFGTKFHSSRGESIRGFIQQNSTAFVRLRGWSGGNRRASSVVVRASSNSDLDSSSGSSEYRVAPLELESPIGQFLSEILKNHPHLVPAAVDQQLEQLQTDINAEKGKPSEEASGSGTDLVLYRIRGDENLMRIAEVKANERKKALEEILYALIVQKFMDANVSLTPAVASTSADARVDNWPSQEEKIEGLHSQEAFEMIKNHLALILGNRMGDSSTVAQISKMRVGQVYAASVMYGYFLKRVDQRFQLEKSMKLLPYASDDKKHEIMQSVAEEMRPPPMNNEVHEMEQMQSQHPEVSSFSAGGVGPGGFGHGVKATRLRTYVMSFDTETLQRYATIRSKEAVSIIERHTEALFGRPEIVITPQGTIDSSKDELIKISFGGLKRLVLEAVTFGSFLWDVESYVDSRYHFVTN